MEYVGQTLRNKQERLYGHVSHPIPAVAGKKVVVRVVSQFGEESTKVVVV